MKKKYEGPVRKSSRDLRTRFFSDTPLPKVHSSEVIWQTAFKRNNYQWFTTRDDEHLSGDSLYTPCLLYTSDAADE